MFVNLLTALVVLPVRLVGCPLLSMCVVVMLLVAPGLAHAGKPEIRELQRKLFVLGALKNAEIDGNDSPALRDSIRAFLTEHRKTASGDAAVDAALGEAIQAEAADILKPYPEPHPLYRPAFSYGGIVNGLAVSPKDNLALSGECRKIARYRLDTGLPLKPFDAHGIALNFAYSSVRKEIVCTTAWDGNRSGILVLDARTGMRKDFVIVPDLRDSMFLKLRVDPSGRIAWIFHPSGIWSVDLETRQVRVLAKGFPDILVDELGVSADGAVLAIEFTYGEASGRKGYPHEVRLYDTASGKVIGSIAGGKNLVLADNGIVYLVEIDGRHEVRESHTGRIVASRKFDTDAPSVDTTARSVVFDKLGRAVLFVTTQGENRALWRWGLDSSAVVKLMTFKETGRYNWIDEADGAVYTVGNDGVVAYDINTGQPRHAVAVVTRMPFKAVAVSPRGNQVVGLSGDRLLGVDMTTGQVRRIGNGDFATGNALSFLDDKTILVGGDGGALTKVSTDSGMASSVATLGGASIDSVVTSRGGRYAAILGTTYLNDKLTYHLRVVATDSGRVVYSRASPELIKTVGFADDDRRIVFGEKWSFLAVDLASGQIIVRQELKTEIRQTGSRITWYWGTVKWILPYNDGRGAVEVGVGSVASGQMYEYAAGKLTLKQGSTFAGDKSSWISGRFELMARTADGAQVGMWGQEPVVSRPPEATWLSRHAAVDGTPIAIGAQGKDRFVVVDDAGTVSLYDRSLRQPIMTTVPGSDGNWLSRIRGGYFAGTRGAAENLFLAVSSDETIAIDGLFDTLYRPDLVAALGAGDPDGKVSEAAKKAEIGKLLKEGLPPRAIIVAPAANGTTDIETAAARAELTVGTGGLGRIEWRVNGVTRIAEVPAAANRAHNGDTVPVEANLLLEPGSNEIELVAFNGVNRIASTPAKTKVVFGKVGAVAEPHLFVLSIGINEYWDSRLKLNFATRDALDVAHSFETAGKGLFEKSETWIITDQRATRNGIQAAFDEIARKIRSTDVFILFVAGHGKTEDGRYYFLPYDLKYTGPTSIAEQGIGQGDWQTWLSRVAARKSLLMFDTCESGTLTLDKVTRGFDRIAALDRLTRATGRSVLAAASDDGPALEGYQGHGVFAYSVLEGLGAADPNRTGLVQVTSLASYVGQRVPELSFGKFGIRQVPQMKLTGEDFSVGRAVVTLEKMDEEFVSPQPTHVLIMQSPLFDEHGTEIAGDPLSAGTLLRVVRSGDTLSVVARAGKKLGFLRTTSLVPMQ